MSVAPEGRAAAMIAYITTEVVRDPAVRIDEDTALVSSGLVDSIALIDVIVELERVCGLRIPTGRVHPEDFETVRLMLAKAARVGR